ncbi:hypothetical protein [Streptomyces iconiensis]|uniref:Uncharacterized protein n=1 Tax=Streptomyces iconiensis TaxID=1384038 RepID=A0ABT7AA80_9ACTN|nr:hypothetical protein [Streptomyces iconiensis]MDJ1137904.1 hypothetical protein [Streptomyces iconiensis]
MTARRCAHTDALYGRCVRHLYDHDGECLHEHQPPDGEQQAGEGR